MPRNEFSLLKPDTTALDCFVACAHQMLDPSTPENIRRGLEPRLLAQLPILRALGIFELFELRDPALRAWLVDELDELDDPASPPGNILPEQMMRRTYLP